MQYQLPSLIRSLYFQVEDNDLPQGGFPAHLPFQFPGLPQMAVQQLTRVVPRDALFYSTAGNSTGGSASTGVFGMIYQIHNGVQLPFFNKPAPLENFTGSGQKPFPIRPTLFVPAGDSLVVEVRSQDRANVLNVEVDLFGTTVNLNNITAHQKIVLDAKRAFLDSLISANKDLNTDQMPASGMSFVIPQSNTPYPAPGAAAVTIGTYRVPPGQRARIAKHALQHVGNNPPELSNSGVIWRFLVNGWPLQGLGAVTTQIAAFATPTDAFILLTENDLLTVTVEIPAGGGVQEGQSGYFASGWTAPLGGNSTTTPKTAGGTQ